MKPILIHPLGALFCLSSVLHAQDLSTPTEIMKILTDSKVHYEILYTSDAPFVSKTQHDKLNTNDYYQVVDEGRIAINQLKISPEIAADYDSAEYYFQADDRINARKYYEIILQKRPDFSIARTYIGQTYRLENTIDQAEKWYKDAIDHNYIDYMAHWFLANVYQFRGEREDALNEILIAHVLNRNNPRLLNDLHSILEENGYSYADWYFTPPIEIEKSDSVVKINYYDPEWIGYGLCKTLWKYEPGYKESKVGTKKGLSSIEEIECLSGLYLTQKNADTLSSNPQLRAVVAAVDQQRILEFIFYEVWSPANPIIMYSQSKEQIEKIVEYIKNVRLIKG